MDFIDTSKTYTPSGKKDCILHLIKFLDEYKTPSNIREYYKIYAYNICSCDKKYPDITKSFIVCFIEFSAKILKSIEEIEHKNHNEKSSCIYKFDHKTSNLFNYLRVFYSKLLNNSDKDVDKKCLDEIAEFLRSTTYDFIDKEFKEKELIRLKELLKTEEENEKKTKEKKAKEEKEWEDKIIFRFISFIGPISVILSLFCFDTGLQRCTFICWVIFCILWWNK